jgi:N utilization substance protein A
MFIDALDVDDVIAHLLVAEGFTSVEEVAYVPIEEMLGIEGFDEDLATELGRRAREYLETEASRLDERRRELNVADDVAALDALNPEMLVALGEAGIKTLDDLADLASDELYDPEEGILKGFRLSEDEANDIIMAARAHWFEDEETGEDDTGTAGTEAADTAAADAEEAGTPPAAG